MRIIGGEFRSRRLLAPAKETTRPVTDRVKQSLFDILAPHLESARVYDCFAGTGSMGLEALSRGASHATFFESDRSAATLLRRNIEALGVARRSRVIDRDLFKWFQAPSPATKVDLVFLDPPYRFLIDRQDELRRVASQLAGHLSDDGIIVFRHEAGDALDLAPFARADHREYGGMTIELLRKSKGDPP